MTGLINSGLNQLDKENKEKRKKIEMPKTWVIKSQVCRKKLKKKEDLGIFKNLTVSYQRGSQLKFDLRPRKFNFKITGIIDS